MSEPEGATFWLAVFTDLRQRGGNDCVVACGDGLTGLPGAFETSVPRTQVQLCIGHNVRQSLRDVVWRERRGPWPGIRELCMERRQSRKPKQPWSALP
ncbi:MAG: hypothetical protein CV088_18300 [Nitrospira sp. LK70]|nr:hypothetical protein [Nitrospira sp. LK70]